MGEYPTLSFRKGGAYAHKFAADRRMNVVITRCVEQGWGRMGPMTHPTAFFMDIRLGGPFCFCGDHFRMRGYG